MRLPTRLSPWLLVAALFAVIGTAIDLAEARPGGGHSYSGGSSSSSGGSGGGDGAGALIYFLIRLIIVWPEVGIPLTIVVVVGVVIAKRKNDGLGDWDSGESIALYNPPSGLDEIRRFDPGFSEVLFSDFAYALYARAHQARVHPNAMASCAPYLSPDAQTALLTREPTGQPVSGVIVGGMRVVSARIPPITEDENGEPSYSHVVLHFEANMTVGAPGAAHTHYVHERWTLARETRAQSRSPEKARSLNCPNCDAPFEASDEGACSFCGEVVNNGSFEWLVTGIELHHDEQRPPKLSGHAPERGTQLETVWHREVDTRLAQLQAMDPASSPQAIGARLKLIFDELTIAWGELDLDRARPFVSDGLHNYLSYWIEAYKAQGLVNRNDNAAIDNWVITKVILDEHYVAVTCRVWATGNDYTMDQSSGKIVGGSKKKARDYSEYWTLIRGAEVTASPRVDKQCPNCGAELKISHSGNCEFCKAHITSGEFDWVLSKIEQDEAYRG